MVGCKSSLNFIVSACAKPLEIQMNLPQYPVWSRIARDYLPIQGLAVPCERRFSSTSITGTDRCNHLAPKTFEALQILKSAYADGIVENTLETVM